MAEKRVSVRLAAVGGRQVRAELEGVEPYPGSLHDATRFMRKADFPLPGVRFDAWRSCSSERWLAVLIRSGPG